MDKDELAKFYHCALMPSFVSYVVDLACRHWDKESVEALHCAILRGWIVPTFKHERGFIMWYNRLMRHVQITETMKKSKGYVYLFQAVSKETGNVLAHKIGLSNTPEKRVTTVFGSKQPFVDVKIVHTIKTDDMDRLETRLHKQYGDKRIDGEWFQLSADDIDSFKSIKGVIYYLDIDPEDFQYIEPTLSNSEAVA